MRESRSVRDLIREFFAYYPDYFLCRTLAENVQESVLTYAEALNSLAMKARAADQNEAEIRRVLDSRRVGWKGTRVPLKDLSLRQLLQLGDEELARVIEFYFKHPYAHGRTLRSRWIPRFLRTVFLSTLLAQARSRGLNLDYPSYFEILRLL